MMIFSNSQSQSDRSSESSPIPESQIKPSANIPPLPIPANYDELINLARQCAQHQDFDQARELIGEAFKLSPERPESLTLSGQITEYLGDRLTAIKFYRAALGLDPCHHPAQENLDRAASNHTRARPSFSS